MKRLQVTEDLHRRVQDWATANGVTMAEAARRIVSAGLVHARGPQVGTLLRRDVTPIMRGKDRL